MTTWFYSEDDERKGPVTEEFLVDLLRNEKLPKSTLVWTSGMDNWSEIHSVDGFQIPTDVPPPIKTSESTDNSLVNKDELMDSGPWRRYAARMFDLAVFGFLLFFLLSPLLLSVSHDLYFQLYESEHSTILLNLVGIPIALIGEAICYSVFKSTPGKKIFAMSVVEKFGNKVSALDYFSRNASLWISALGFGIPIVNLFTMSSQYNSLKKSGFAGYDQADGIRVVYKKRTPLGSILAALIFIAVFFVFISLSAYEQSEERKKQNYAKEDASVSSVQRQADILKAQLIAVAKATNPSLPKYVDEHTLLEKAVADESTLRFIYSMPKVASSDIDDSVLPGFRQEMKQSITSLLCNDSPLSDYLKRNASLEFIYNDKDGLAIISLLFTKQSCL